MLDLETLFTIASLMGKQTLWQETKALSTTTKYLHVRVLYIDLYAEIYNTNIHVVLFQLPSVDSVKFSDCNYFQIGKQHRA